MHLQRGRGGLNRRRAEFQSRSAPPPSASSASWPLEGGVPTQPRPTTWCLCGAQGEMGSRASSPAPTGRAALRHADEGDARERAPHAWRPRLRGRDPTEVRRHARSLQAMQALLIFRYFGQN
eukprot:5649258-Pyramimonas_sp.AAC.1